MFKFQPMEESPVYEMLAEGEYDFFVKDAKEKLSKNGNEMLEIKLAINKDDKEFIVYDRLLEAWKYKLKHFCYAVGLENEYKSGGLDPSEVIGRCGRLKLIIEEPEGYLARNAVEDYLKSDKPQEIKKYDEFKDCEIPF